MHFGTYSPIQSPMGRLISGIFLWIGLLVVLFGVYCAWSYSEIEDELVPVEAIIERIDIRGRGDNRDYDVYVSYSYQGTRYDQVRLSWYNSGMEEGQRLALKIHPNDPSELVDNDGILVLVFGGVFTLVGGTFSIAARWDDLKNRFARKEEDLC